MRLLYDLVATFQIDGANSHGKGLIVNGAIRSLLASIVDYAGLFPPAGLDMRAAVQNYSAYSAGEFAWLLGRFIVPVARLAEFESVAYPHEPNSESGRQAWRLSALAGSNCVADSAAIADFNRRHASLVIDTIELKAPNADEIAHAMRLVPPGVCAYIEVPMSSDESLLAAARSTGARMKVRTGGVTPQAFPTCAEFAGFIVRSAAVGVPFKATAGLHHPIRAEHRLTYADDSPRSTMHGFLNVFLAAAGVRAGMTAEQATRLLDETLPDAFRFDDDGASWKGHRWSTGQLRATRQEFAISFGSCSFQEPIDDLSAIGLLNP